MLPEERATPDISGHPVDLYPSDSETYLSVATIAAGLITEDALRESVLDSMRSMESLSPRLRHRDFPVYICTWSAIGRRFIGIGLPDRFPAELHRLFRQNLRQCTEISEVGRSLAIDVNAQPFALYNHGALVAYIDPFDPRTEGVYGEDVELRSAAYKPMRKQRPRREPLPVIRHQAPQRHSISIWNDLKVEILEFIYETIYVGTFTSLRRAVESQFGIGVQLAATGSAGRHGSIMTDWVTPNDFSCNVTIYINKDLPTQLKYVVLSHELAHYVLHFPILIAGQMIEQASWFSPHIECAYHELYHDLFGDGKELEEQADALATNLLFPPQLAAVLLNASVTERNRVPTREERTWSALAEFFPERSSVQYSWHNQDEMIRLAEQELAQNSQFNDLSDQTLYRSMLRAALRRDSDEFTQSSENVNHSVYEFWEKFPGLAQCPACFGDHAKEYPATQIDAAPEVRTFVTPLTGSATDALRLPLVPVAQSRSTGKWTCVLDPSGPSYSLDDWRLLYPEHALILYSNRHLPSTPLAHIIEE